MTTPYVGEIRMFGGNFAPLDWNFCDGTLLPIGQYNALFNLIGTTYGGNGQTNFALPDLRGRLPIHQGSGFPLAATGGTETVTLSLSQIPAHNHPVLATANGGSTANPTGQVLANPAPIDLYIPASGTENLDSRTIGATGGSQPHTNFQPYLCVNFIISLFGIYPTQS